MDNSFEHINSKNHSLESSPFFSNVTPLMFAEYGRALDASAIVSIANSSGVITYVNRNFCRISEYHYEELIGQTHAFTKHPDTPISIYEELWRTISSGNTWQGILKNISKHNEEYTTNCTIVPIKNAAGRIIEFICIRFDITQLFEQQDIINSQYMDKVTNLPNSMKLIADGDKLVNTHTAVLTIPELDKIQNTYTIAFYHKLVKAITEFISPQIPNHYTLYRLSENMFAISPPANSSFDELKSCCHLLQYFFEEQNIVIEATTFKFSIIIGLAKSSTVDNTLINAKMALSYALDNSKNFSIYKKENKVHEKILNAIDWGNKIKEAINNSNVCIFGQNIVNEDKKTVYTEVLMRLFDPQKSEYISPFHFLDIAKQANLYHQLSQQVLMKAIRHFSNLQCPFSINLSAEDIKNAQTRRLLLELLNHYRVGYLMTIELVESEICNLKSPKFLSFIEQLKALGCQLAIDDFGSGYSNFNYLLALPIDILKIDGSLIKNISKNERHYILTESILNICHKLNIKVVAEFVTNHDDFTILKKLNVHYFQGYLFDKPKKLNELR